MAQQPGRPKDDPSSAPESGMVQDETTGNNPSPSERLTHPGAGRGCGAVSSSRTSIRMLNDDIFRPAGKGRTP